MDITMTKEEFIKMRNRITKESQKSLQLIKDEIDWFAQDLDVSKDGQYTKNFIVAKLRQLSSIN